MADEFLRARVEGTEELKRQLERLNPGLNREISARSLSESMLLVLRNAATRGIYRGGKGDPKTDILTSRTGTLRRSLSSSFALDRAGLPRFIEGGTNLIYGAVHEQGGTFNIGSSTVRAHTRKVRGIGTPLDIKSHTRRAHTATYPQRSFLAPGLRMSESQFPVIFSKWWKRLGDLS